MADRSHVYSSEWLNKLIVVFPFLAWLPMVNAKTLKADMFAGITGAVIVLP